MDNVPSTSAAIAGATVLIGFFLLAAGCTAPTAPTADTTASSRGATAVTTYDSGRPVNFTAAWDQFRIWVPGGFSDIYNEERIGAAEPSLPAGPDAFISPSVTVHLVQGIGLGSDGSARSWLFGFLAGNRSFLAEYSGGMWLARQLPGDLPSGVIDPGAILPPNQIIGRHRSLLASLVSPYSTVPAMIELKDGIYIITVWESGKRRVFSFDAALGTVIPSP
jgi:hypothetical protein